MFSGKRERALEEELRAAQEKADKNQRNLEKYLQELEEQMTSVEQVAEQSEAAAGAIYSTILAGKNGLESFRASHTVFLGKVKEQSDKVSEAAEEGRKVQQKAEELLTKFAEPFRTVSAVSLTTYKLPSAAPKLPASAVLPVSSAG